jgi:hypothetical protein
VRFIAAAALLATVAALSACGSKDSGTTPQDAVKAVVSRFGVASARKDYQAICDRLIAKSLSDNVEEYGLPCELAFKQGMDSVVKPQLKIVNITVKGDVAKVHVHTTAANQPASDDLLELRRQAGQWRITALGAVPATPRAGGTPTTTTG